MKTIRFMGELCLALALLGVGHEAFAARSCSLDGKTISSGSSITAYQSSSVPYGSSCKSQVRYCMFGYLLGSDSYRSSSCTVALPVVATVNPPSLYRCTFRQEYNLAQMPFYDANFALAPDNDYDCLNANNFFAQQVGGYYSTIPGTKAIWDYQKVLKIYDGSPVTINPSMCATRLYSSQDVIKAPTRMSPTECHAHCLNVSVASPDPVMCFFAHTPVETAVSGWGDDRWTRPPPPPPPPGEYNFGFDGGYMGGG